MNDKPLYQSEGDSADEQRVVEHICMRWDCDYIRLPRRYELEYALHRGGEVCAWLEARVRNYSLADIDKLGGYVIDLSKWNTAQTLVAFTNRPFYLAVQTLCGGWVAQFRDFQSADIRIGGATNSNGRHEPVVMIPVKRFMNFRERYQELKP